MRITIVAVGRLKERFWREAADEYLKRLRGYADVRVVEVADRDPAHGGEAKARDLEGVAVVKALPEGAHVVCLDRGGAELDSEALAASVAALKVRGVSHVAFVIGGSTGLAPAVLDRADERLSLGRMTFPHNLARVIVLEQVYRAFRIMRGEPYHK